MEKMINDQLVETSVEHADKVLIDLEKDKYILADFSNNDNFQLLISGVETNDVVSLIAHLLLNVENKIGVPIESICEAIIKDQGKLVQEEQ